MEHCLFAFKNILRYKSFLKIQLRFAHIKKYVKPKVTLLHHQQTI